MGRPKKTLEHEWYDIFSDADLADQDAMLRVLAELHRQKRRGRLETKTNAIPNHDVNCVCHTCRAEDGAA